MTGRLAVHRVDACTSTHDVARELIGRGCPDGTLILAAEQTAGRGRRGRTWFSPPGNVYLSYVHRSDRDASGLAPLTLDAAVAVATAVEDLCGVRPTLKWPNDLVVDAGAGYRKLAGVLTELESSAAGAPTVLVGVGVNVELEAATLPAELRDVATSLRAVTGQGWDAGELGLLIGRRLREKLAGFEALGRPDLAAWRPRFAALVGRRVRLSTMAEAEILGLADDGGLRVRAIGQRDEEVVRSGEILLWTGEASAP